MDENLADRLDCLESKLDEIQMQIANLGDLELTLHSLADEIAAEVAEKVARLISSR